MKGTLKIATFFKIPVYLHWSFPLIFLYVLFIGNQIGAGPIEMSAIAVFLLLIFLCVLMHEYGHALTARRYGVNTRDIILSPIGGIARLEKIPEKPSEELKVALAGPAVNVVIALILLPIVYFLRKDGLIYEGESELEALQNWNNLLPLVLGTNVLLVVFNMIPAFPMDGGRVLRSILAMRMDRVKATKIAFIIAQVAALFMFVYGIYASQYVLCFIAIFVVITSRTEWKGVAREDALNNKTVEDLTQPITQKIYLDQRLNEIGDFKKSQPKNYLVFDRNDQVIGVLFHQFILHAIKENDTDALVEKYLSHTWETIYAHYPLKHAIGLFQKRGYGIVPVQNKGQLIGQLDMIHINNYIQNI
jgi:Zn-dependent protease